MRYTITGDNLQFVNIQLDPDETIRATPGNFKYMSGNMRMDTKMEGGLLKGLKRSISGASFFLVNFKSEGGTGVVGLGGNVPGKIIDLKLDGTKTYLLQRSAYLASDPGVDVDIGFQKKLGSIFFGGEGWSFRGSAAKASHGHRPAVISTSSTSSPESSTRSPRPTL